MRDNDLLLVIMAFALGAVVGANWPKVKQNALGFVEAIQLPEPVDRPEDLIIFEKPAEAHPQ